MTTRMRVHLSFPEELVTEPIIYRMGRDFEVVTSIRRANIEEGKGWVILDVHGEQDEVQRALEWVRGQGIEAEVIEAPPG